MSNKEFEAKKQELLDCLYELDANFTKKQLAEYDKSIKLIKQLQPPKPPTCATCKYYNQLYSNAGNCANGFGNHWIINENEYTQLVDDKFGCVHHLSYEVAK